MPEPLSPEPDWTYREEPAGERCPFGHEWHANEQLESLRAALDAERAKTERLDWLRIQLDGCIDDAQALAAATSFALARSLVRNLQDARDALASGEADTDAT